MELTLITTGIILILCFLGLSWFAGSDAPFVRTKNFTKILRIAGLKKGQRFYDLGSGDGRLVFEAAKLGADSFGVEQSWLRVLWCRFKAKQLASYMSSGNVKFIHGNIFSPSFWRPKGPIESADVIYIYLLSEGVSKLEPILKKTLKKNATVITKAYHFKNWKAKKIAGDFKIYQV